MCEMYDTAPYVQGGFVECESYILQCGRIGTPGFDVETELWQQRVIIYLYFNTKGLHDIHELPPNMQSTQGSEITGPLIKVHQR